jgi:glycosyltransferase involved in cell wall biosynthesis
MKISCGIFANIAPLYSKPLWYELSSSTDVDYYFYSSRSGYSSIRTININESRNIDKSGKLNWFFLKNIYVRSILIYQLGIVYVCMKTMYDVYIFNGEMNCISTWLASIVCKIRNKPVIFWGHGIYGNEKFLKKKVRILFYKMADYHLVYGNRSRNLMTGLGFQQDKVFTVYNSLDFRVHEKLYNEIERAEMTKIRQNLFPGRSEYPVLIYIGRLTKEKKISYLLKAVELSMRKGRTYNCLIVGNGIELHNLERLRDSMNMTDSVCFYGASYDEEVNAKLIMLADCCISPGNVGLTAIHSLSLGTPVITHGNFNNQGPEAEAIIPGKTGMLFRENDVSDLSDVIDSFISKRIGDQMKAECINVIRKFWNPSGQRKIFDETVKLSHETLHLKNNVPDSRR